MGDNERKIFTPVISYLKRKTGDHYTVTDHKTGQEFTFDSLSKARLKKHLLEEKKEYPEWDTDRQKAFASAIDKWKNILENIEAKASLSYQYTFWNTCAVCLHYDNDCDECPLFLWEEKMRMSACREDAEEDNFAFRTLLNADKAVEAKMKDVWEEEEQFWKDAEKDCREFLRHLNYQLEWGSDVTFAPSIYEKEGGDAR